MAPGSPAAPAAGMTSERGHDIASPRPSPRPRASAEPGAIRCQSGRNGAPPSRFVLPDGGQCRAGTGEPKVSRRHSPTTPDPPCLPGPGCRDARPGGRRESSVRQTSAEGANGSRLSGCACGRDDVREGARHRIPSAVTPAARKRRAGGYSLPERPKRCSALAVRPPGRRAAPSRDRRAEGLPKALPNDARATVPPDPGPRDARPGGRPGEAGASLNRNTAKAGAHEANGRG